MTSRTLEYRTDIRAMLRIAVPLALAELGWMAMGVVDTIMVGRLPDSAIAIGATSVGGALFYGLAVFGLGLMSGLDTLVSQSFGAGDLPSARRSLWAGLLLAVVLTPPFMAAAVALAPALAAIGVDAPVARGATGFIRVLVWSLPLLLIYTVFRRYLQGIHYVRPVAWALVSSNIINAAGNWILIYGRLGAPHLGIEGSALSTDISRVYLAAYLLIAIRRRDPAALRFHRPGLALLKRLLLLGLPAAMAIGFEVWVFNLATALIATLDPVSLAAHTIAINAAALTYMVPLGISSAAAVTVGRAWGATDFRDARRAGWTAIGIAAGFEIFSALAFLVFPRLIAEAYTTDRRVIDMSVRLLAIAAAFQMFDGIQATAAGALRGLGDTKSPMISTLISYWIVGLPLGCWLCYRAGWGVFGIWWGLCLALALVAASLVPVWARGSNPRSRLSSLNNAAR